MTDWDQRFLALAEHIAGWSKDPSTKTGAVIVDPDRRIVSVGYNGFPRGVLDMPTRLEDRETKYKMIVHCMAPHHRTLMQDLRWVDLGSLRVGDELVAFDEYIPQNRRGRQYRRAVVTRVEFAEEPTYRVVLDTGEELFATAEHRWLTTTAGSRMWKWRRTDELRPEPEGRGYPSTKITRILQVFEEATDYEAGWLAGILDGEGTVGANHTIHVAQRPGIVLDTIVDVLQKRARPFTLRLVDNVMRGGLGDGDCREIHIRGTRSDRLAFVGSIRPKRLLRKFANADEFGELHRRHKNQHTHAITKVIPAGTRDIVKVTTSTGTLFVEGYPVHNCEINAILFAPSSVRGCTLLTWPFMSCSRCAGPVIQAGLVEVVAPKSENPRWTDDFVLAQQMFNEAGVKVRLLPMVGE